MERTTEILNSVKERVSNPFIFSFIVSWLLYNWQIPVALLWYNAQNIKSTEYSTIFDLITYQIQKDGSFSYPFGISIGITLAIPVLRIAFTTFNAAVTRLGNYLFFEISKESSISTSRYLGLREKYLQSLSHLEEVIKAEADYELKYRELQSNQVGLQENWEVLKRMKDDSFLQGRWELIYVQSNKKVSMVIMSNNVQLTEPTDTGGHKTFPNENLSFFERDTRSTERLIFQIKRIDLTLLNYNFSKLGEGRYEGFENLKDQVTLTKIS